MGCFIITDDGRAVALNNRGHDWLIEEIANSLPTTAEGTEFKNWLLDRRVSVTGVGHVDVRELTQLNQRLFWDAVGDTIRRLKLEGPGSLYEPDFFESGVVKPFRILVKLHKSYLRGEPPESFNPYMRAAIPPTGEKDGPGW